MFRIEKKKKKLSTPKILIPNKLTTWRENRQKFHELPDEETQRNSSAFILKPTSLQLNLINSVFRSLRKTYWWNLSNDGIKSTRFLNERSRLNNKHGWRLIEGWPSFCNFIVLLVQSPLCSSAPLWRLAKINRNSFLLGKFDCSVSDGIVQLAE